ncbi:hypothetical protein [Caballeronia sp. LZ035]|uniref:hypothetical protein n=1 Tax=Caballeronia sp. LZ035 TaxID=3038568 RepID=UPI00285B9460|nr:hypothetical protein [Caballeronia sp. LZ035]MDR5763272.1 hypothetical protein [Caballeronia sp. LZ035]
MNLPRYPGYDVTDKRDTPSWDEVTRGVIDERLATPTEPRFLDAVEWRALTALCACIVPQDHEREPAPLPALIDAKLVRDVGDGYRDARLPMLRDAWRIGLAAQVDFLAFIVFAHRQPCALMEDIGRAAMLAARNLLRIIGHGDSPSAHALPCRAWGREALGTSVLDGDPDVILKMPEDAYAPFWLGVASLLFFAGLALQAWWFAGLSLLGCGAAIVAWLWPQRELGQRDDAPHAEAAS